MRLIASGFTTAETSFAGSPAAGSTAMEGKQVSFTVDRIVVFGASSVAENSSGGVKFNYGASSADIFSTLVVLGGPTSGGLYTELSGLNIQTRYFEAFTNEAGAGGYGIFIFGN